MYSQRQDKVFSRSAAQSLLSPIKRELGAYLGRLGWHIGAAKFYTISRHETDRSGAPKEFGFVFFDQGEVWFHRRNAREFALRNGQPNFVAPKDAWDKVTLPKMNDLIVFQSRVGPGGMHATDWGYVEELRLILPAPEKKRSPLDSLFPSAQ